MAYQNVSTPRIYLNIPEWLASTGTTIDPVFRTLPVSASTVTEPPDISAVTLTNPYIALLGHTETDSITLEGASVQGGGIINGDFSNGVVAGFSIAKLDVAPTAITTTNNVGSILIGTFYDFPHSPDLNLSLSYEYGGIKETTTKGGATLTNQFYNKPPAWGSLGAWELGGEPKYAKLGRRVWDLSFSYISDSSVFPDNAGLVNETDADTNLTLLEDDSFQRVITLTNGGQLPFIFQPDGTQDSDGNYNNAKPDSFAIAKFDMNSFSFEQVAKNIYNIKLKIREVW